MITVAEATSIVLAHPFVSRKEIVNLPEAIHRVLAEPIYADRDFPPFDRVMMDGIAIQASVFHNGARAFTIEKIQAAGQAVTTLEDANNCIEVMTGALLPQGTDTVVPYEWLEIKNDIATFVNESVVAGQNIHLRGSDAKQKEKLLDPGIIISPAEVALLASTGNGEVLVYSLPKIAVISTGDELIDIEQNPLPHQIRKSNSYALQAAFAEMGCASDVFHLPDNKEKLERALANVLLHYEVIVLSGGVSKGKFDYVPQALEANGIKKLFHQVSQRPGKPFWFGRSDQHTVFALPGNPVSTYMCFFRYIKPWLLQSLHFTQGTAYAILASDFTFAPSLTYFLQVEVKNEGGKLMAYPAAGGGSGDFANLKNVTGFLELPLEKSQFKAGEAYPYLRFRA